MRFLIGMPIFGIINLETLPIPIMKKAFVSLLLAVFAVVAVQTTLYAQKDPSESLTPRASPMAVAKTMYGDEGYAKVVYCRPQKKGREIFGGIVAYDKVWRTGANEATEVTFTEDIEINGKTLEAGTYALFTIPGKDEWTVIFNSALGQWGAYQYDESKDVMRVKADVQESDQMYEAFTIAFAEDGSSMMMVWDKTMVTVPLG